MEVYRTQDSVVSTLIHSDLDRDQVEMWTTRRLAFEPKGALLEARNLLRRELHRLVAGPQSWLDARYLSLNAGFVDTENVLLYNVGPSAFALASRSGLRFSREFTLPPIETSIALSWQHYHVYSLVPKRTDFEQLNSPPAAQFEFAMPSLSVSLKPHDYWWAAKQALTQVDTNFQLLPDKYMASIRITGPTFPDNVAALVKPLFDGIISALHWDTAIEPHDTVCELLGARLGSNAESVAEMLRSSANSIFGHRKVVAPYREFVKWNPADELCIVGELVIERSESTTWSVTVAIRPIDS